MDFAYTPAQQELTARAAAYAELLMGYEDEAERAGGPLPKETVDKLTRAAMDAGMLMPYIPASNAARVSLSTVSFGSGPPARSASSS